MESERGKNERSNLCHHTAGEFFVSSMLNFFSQDFEDFYKYCWIVGVVSHDGYKSRET